MKRYVVAALLCSSALSAVAQEGGGGPGGQPPPRPLAPLQAQNGKLSLLYGNGLNLSSNTLVLGAPTATVLGGIYSAAAPANQFQTGNNAGTPTFRQPSFADLLGSLAATQMPALTGDVSAPAGSTATTIGPGAVTASKMAAGAAYGNLATNGLDYTKLSQAPAGTYSGNPTGATANRQDMSAAQATAGLNAFTPDTGSGGLKGLVPGLPAGAAAANWFLGANGWAPPNLTQPFIQAAALCDGSTDDTAAIQAAFTAASTSVKIKTVRVPAGTCVVTAGTLKLPAYVSLLGQGAQATLLKTTSATGDVLQADGGTTIADIGFDSSVTRTAGRFIFVTPTNSNQRVDISRFYMNKAYQGIYLDATSGIAWISHGLLQNETGNSTAANSAGIVNASPADIYITDVMHRSDSAVAAQNAYAVLEQLNGAVICTDCDFLQGQRAIAVIPSSSSQIAFLKVANSYLDTTYGSSVVIYPTGGATVGDATFTGVWVGPVGGNGYEVSGADSSSRVFGFKVVGGHSQNYNNGAGSGVLLGGNVLGPVQVNSSNWGLPNQGFSVGVNVTGNASNFQVNSNYFYSCANVGVNVGSGSSTNYMIQGNMSVGCTNGTLFDGGTGSRKSVSGNL